MNYQVSLRSFMQTPARIVKVNMGKCAYCGTPGIISWRTKGVGGDHLKPEGNHLLNCGVLYIIVAVLDELSVSSTS